MTASSILESWAQEANPLEQVFALLEKAQDVPEEVPVAEVVGGLDIRCGPILRLLGTLEQGKTNYRASLMLVTKDESTTVDAKVTYTQGPVNAKSESDFKQGEFPGKIYDRQDGHTFWRFSIDLSLMEYEQKVRYTVNDALTFDFYIPRVDQPMNVISYSCNGFSLSTKTESFKGSLWYDVLRKHYQDNRYHVMLGGGDQLYCDAVKNSSQIFHKWLGEKNPIKKLRAKAGEDVINSFHDFYLNQYLKWFGKGFWVGTAGRTLQSLYPFAMACIPSMNIFDDHDIIDGFGSYHDSTMSSEMFMAVGKIAYKYYMLFQHQTSVDNDSEYHNDPSWILGKAPGPFITEKSHSTFAKLGKGVAFLGLDCRTERKLKQIVSPETYDIVFQRLRQEVQQDPNIKHLLVLLGVPIAYPRLVWLEWLLTSSILAPIRTLAQKGVIAKGLVNEFDGSVEVLDDLNDHWCSKHHKKERNALVAKLQDFGSSSGIRITILSGDVHLCAVGRFKTKLHHHLFGAGKHEESNQKVLDHPEEDPRLMFNVISSAIVNAPPPDAMAGLLNKRSNGHHFDRKTDEDMVPLFEVDVDGSSRSNKQFLNKRNWCDLIPISNFNPNGDKPGYEIGTSKFPQSAAGLPENFKPELERDFKYMITENSLVTRIHVEKDPGDIESKTMDYEIIVPELVGKHQLRDIGVKD